VLLGDPLPDDLDVLPAADRLQDCVATTGDAGSAQASNGDVTQFSAEELEAEPMPRALVDGVRSGTLDPRWLGATPSRSDDPDGAD
jgi:hypothetical protein